MIRIRLTLLPRTAFGTHLLGDTLFGQLCWAIRHRFGEDRLTELLGGYIHGRPFLVVSDAFPSGYLPRPVLPADRYATPDNTDRKEIKRRRWLPLAESARPLQEWLGQSQTDTEVGKRIEESQPHNSINRLTGTTGTGMFAPYQTSQLWFQTSAQLDCYCLLDSDRLSRDELFACFEDMGTFGYGRDASVGLGKFVLESHDSAALPAHPQANALLTLAPCAPQGLGLDPERSFYQTFTRFGRHGDTAVQSGKPFKTPLLLAATGAVFTPRPTGEAAFTTLLPPGEGPGVRADFIGQGLGGAGRLSKALPATVHQGYAPVLPVWLHDPKEERP